MKETPKRLEDSIATVHGQALYSEQYWPAGKPKGVVVLVHGMAEHLGRYSHIFKILLEKGYQILAYDQRGHGRSTGQRCHVNDFREYEDDLKIVMEKAADYELPIYLLAHSMGALVALGYLSRHHKNGLCAGAALIGLPLKPVVEVPAYKHALGLICGKYFPRLRLATEIDPRDICHNEAVVERYRKDPLVTQEATAGWYRAFVQRIEELPRSLDTIEVPALFLHGGDDRIAHPDGSRVIFQAYPGTRKQLHIYEGCFHELLNEDCHPGIVDEIDLWYQQSLVPAQQVVSVGR